MTTPNAKGVVSHPSWRGGEEEEKELDDHGAENLVIKKSKAQSSTTPCSSSSSSGLSPSVQQASRPQDLSQTGNNNIPSSSSPLRSPGPATPLRLTSPAADRRSQGTEHNHHFEDSVISPNTNNSSDRDEEESGSEMMSSPVAASSGTSPSSGGRGRPGRRSHGRRGGRGRDRSGDDRTGTKSFSEMSVRGLDLLRYATISSDGTYRCIECERVQITKNFKNKYSFQRHAFLYHEGHARKVFPCPICQKEFSRPDKMKSHLKTAHDCIIPKADSSAASSSAAATAAAAAAVSASLSNPTALLVNPFLNLPDPASSEGKIGKDSTRAGDNGSSRSEAQEAANAAAAVATAAAASFLASTNPYLLAGAPATTAAGGEESPASPPRMTPTRSAKRRLNDSAR